MSVIYQFSYYLLGLYGNFIVSMPFIMTSSKQNINADLACNELDTCNAENSTHWQIYYLSRRIFYPPGGRLNEKDGLTRYGDSHVKDKTS